MYDISVLNCQKFSGIISVVYKPYMQINIFCRDPGFENVKTAYFFHAVMCLRDKIAVLIFLLLGFCTHQYNNMQFCCFKVNIFYMLMV